jgi:hypothetical protein
VWDALRVFIIDIYYYYRLRRVGRSF